MFFHGVDQAEPEAQADGDPGQQHSQGDGLHHHEIHELPEDEGGGFHSKHIHPDGREEHGDHADYEEAQEHQDHMFGQGDGEDDTEEPADDGEDDNWGEDEDVAGSYGRHARE